MTTLARLTTKSAQMSLFLLIALLPLEAPVQFLSLQDPTSLFQPLRDLTQSPRRQAPLADNQLSSRRIETENAKSVRAKLAPRPTKQAC